MTFQLFSAPSWIANQVSGPGRYDPSVINTKQPQCLASFNRQLKLVKAPGTTGVFAAPYCNEDIRTMNALGDLPRQRAACTEIAFIAIHFEVSPAQRYLYEICLLRAALRVAQEEANRSFLHRSNQLGAHESFKKGARFTDTLNIMECRKLFL